MISEEEKKAAAEYFLKILETQGVVVSTVTDGHVLSFRRIWLETMLKAYPDDEKFLIFIKQPDFRN